MIPSKPSQLAHAGDQLQITKALEMDRMVNCYSASLPRKPENTTSPLSPARTLAVVGSTGFLGPYIVASLLQEYPESNVICFNRSNSGEQRTMAALQEIMGEMSSVRQRLKFLVTNIASRVRELHHDPIVETIPKVEELVFNAWDANWGKSLGSFEPLLKGLRVVVDLLVSAPSCPRITFISSICAVGDWPLRHPDRPLVPEEVIWDCNSAMPNGYGQSKCVAEQLLAKAYEIAKLRVNIIRAGQIGGPMSLENRTWPRQGWLYSIIQSSVKIGAFPNRVQPLDWIPVDALAQGIANCIKLSSAAAGLQVYNMVHPRPTSWTLLHKVLHTRFGFLVELVDLPEWLRRINHEDLRIHSFLSTQGGGRETNMSYEINRAKAILPPVSLIDVDVLATWLSGWGLEPRARI
ncbi:hypothetical protein ACJQWK_02934 [Exserohilum turcicum]